MQRAYRVYGLHPRETWECAFDVVCGAREAAEACARTLAAAHDVIRRVMLARADAVQVGQEADERWQPFRTLGLPVIVLL